MGDIFDQVAAQPQSGGDIFDQIAPAGPAPVAELRAGGNVKSSPGLQYSRGYASTGDAPRDSGPFIERLTTEAGRAIDNPRNFIPSINSAMGPVGSLYDLYNQAKEWYQQRNAPPPLKPDVAKTLGDAAPGVLSALVTHAADAGPNLATAAKSEVTSQGMAHPVQGMVRGIQGLEPDLVGMWKHPITSTVGKIPSAIKGAIGEDIRIYPVPREAPAWRSAQPSGNTVNIIGSTPEEVQANLTRMAQNATAREAMRIKMQANNASGQTDASLEAINRANSEQTQGITHSIVDNAGNRVPVRSIDVSGGLKAGPGKTLVQNLPDGTEIELDRGAGANYRVAAGKIAKPVGVPSDLGTMERAQSSTIHSHDYNPAQQTMRVRFNNGNVYSVRGVPQEIFDGYRNAESQGSYYQQNIKGRYETRLIGKVPTPGARAKAALGKK